MEAATYPAIPSPPTTREARWLAPVSPRPPRGFPCSPPEPAEARLVHERQEVSNVPRDHVLSGRPSGRSVPLAFSGGDTGAVPFQPGIGAA